MKKKQRKLNIQAIQYLGRERKICDQSIKNNLTVKGS